METDYVNPGRWVGTVEARVGVDVNKDGKIDHWTDWTEIKESYDYIKGFSKQIATRTRSVEVAGWLWIQRSASFD